MSVYAQDGVDFSKEHEVVDVFKALFEATKPFTADLETYGIYPPEDIGYFSDAVVVDTEKLYRAMEGKKIAMVFGMDGAGTKPRAHLAYVSTGRDMDAEIDIASVSGLSRASVGIDTIAMVANDLICGGARPAFILDYVAWQEPKVEIARDLAIGLYEGAKQSGATIVGGENASLSEMLNGYDICASATGFVLNPKYIENPLTGKAIAVGDSIIGIGSSGIHCNGISIARKKLINFPNFGWRGKYRLDEVVPELGKTAAEEILTPTIIYKRPVLDGVLADGQFDVKAIVNITGEGIHNLRRALPPDTSALIDLAREEKLRPQPVFDLIQREGEIPDREMWEDFNNGIGMIMVVPRSQEEYAIGRLEEFSVGGKPIRASRIGSIVEQGDRRIFLKTDRFDDVY
jgi:phosphoribosylformylglycinamidine cyclo-ligase